MLEADRPSYARRPSGRLWFLLLPGLTFGFGTFAVFLCAAHRTRLLARRGPPGSRATLRPLGLSPSVLLALAALTAVLGLAAGPAVRVVLWVVGIVLAVQWRASLFPPDDGRAALPPPVARAYARRALREQYRRLAVDDPAIAREIGLGLPHLWRDYDDGGLLDLNRVPAHVLVDLGGLTREQAAQVVELREQRRGLASLDEVVVFTDLPHDVAERLRDYAVVVPR